MMRETKQSGYIETPPLLCEICEERVVFRIHYGHHRWTQVGTSKHKHRLTTNDGDSYELFCGLLGYFCAGLETEYTSKWDTK